MTKSGKKTTKLPKKIGGVKLSKTVRRAGGKLIDKANSPKGREAIAAGLAMAASAAASRARPRPPVPPQADGAPPEQPARRGQPGIPPELNQIVDAFSSATTAFLNGFFNRKG